MTDHYVIYRDEAGEWRWKFIADNGREMAESGEGYTERNDCREALSRFAAAAYSARVDVHD